MEAMQRLRKWFVVAALIGALALACLPGGDEPVEYLERPDAIIIQMLNVSGQPQPEIADRLTLPVFTLYGDGALIFAQTGGAEGTRLLEAELSKDAIEDLLAFIVGEGFLNFAYEHAGERGATDSTTTFLYVNTKAGVNSTSADDLGAGSPADRPEEFQRIAGIAQRLSGLDPEAAGGRVVGPYEYGEIALFVQPLIIYDGEPQAWPIAGVDLAGLAPPGSSVVRQVFTLAEAAELVELRPEGAHSLYRQGDRLFAVGYRPLLPFEENFPEFDFP
jgi:hypothetical protein